MQRKVNRVPSKILKDHTILVTETGAEVMGCPGEYIEESKYHNNSYKNIVFIGEFSIDYSEDDLIFEDILISNIIKSGKKTLNYQILVYSNEGPIPHFHIKGAGNDVDICICIYEARYFDHGSHMGRLNVKELKILNDFLGSSFSEKESYWDLIRITCDINNPDNYSKYPQFRIAKEQPDYTHMQGYKSGR